MKIEKLHNAPYSGTNNRKKTKCRIKDDLRAFQSVPVFSKKTKKVNGLVIEYGKILLGYKYIIHLTH